ncbi:MAG: MaoC family dehydratase N-terminal domain-containing protein, partial [Dehalococcoidia bacterium]
EVRPMTQATVITDEMRAAIGKESPPTTFELDSHSCRMFARAVGYTDPVYFDEDYARSKGYRGIPAPVGFLGHAIFDPSSPQRPPGYSMFQSPFKRILNGGTDIEYFDTPCAGDTLTATGKLVDISEREGKVGPMLVTQTETTYRNQAGDIVAIARGTAIQY